MFQDYDLARELNDPFSTINIEIIPGIWNYLWKMQEA